MIVTIFRSRLKPESADDYRATAAALSELVRELPGYLSHKSFLAEDGEKVTIVEFESDDALDSWRTHPDHIAAKRLGVERYFSEYSMQICSVQRKRAWSFREYRSPIDNRKGSAS
ncbi:MAG: antibiotic biosynthesis monooxygenase [Rhizobiaceae bacterium]